MKVLLRNPKRELEITGPVGVHGLLRELGLKREAVLVIVDGTLVTADTTIEDGSEVEIRPVVSGGAVSTGPVLAGPVSTGPVLAGPVSGDPGGDEAPSEPAVHARLRGARPGPGRAGGGAR